MKIYIKRYLLEEGVIQGVKDNWGSLLIAGLGIAAAHSGALGPKAQHAVDSGGSNLKNFLNDAGDRSKQMADFYKPKIENKFEDAKETTADKFDQLKNKVEDTKDDLPNTLDNLKDKTNSMIDNGAKKIDTFNNNSISDTFNKLTGND